MPGQRQSKKSYTASQTSAKREKKFLEKILQARLTESYISLLLGIVVVIVAAVFLVIFLKNRKVQDITTPAKTVAPVVRNTPTSILTPTSLAQKQLPPPTFNQKTYIVTTGDDLWHISEKLYGTGYNWVDIARANNLVNPGLLYAGTKLIVPSVAPKLVQHANAPPITQQTVQPSNGIIGNEYIVQKGDTLWSIAVRSYADGYKWTAIAQANNLANPDIIHSGNVLKIPRPKIL